MKTMLHAVAFAGLLGCSVLACSAANPQADAESSTSAAELAASTRAAPPLRTADLERLYSALRSGRLDNFTAQEANAAFQRAKGLLPEHAAAFDQVSEDVALQQLSELRHAARATSLEEFTAGINAKLHGEGEASTSAYKSELRPENWLAVGLVLGGAAVLAWYCYTDAACAGAVCSKLGC